MRKAVGNLEQVHEYDSFMLLDIQSISPIFQQSQQSGLAPEIFPESNQERIKK